MEFWVKSCQQSNEDKGWGGGGGGTIISIRM